MTGIQKLQEMGRIIGKYRQAAERKMLNLNLDQMTSECEKHNCKHFELQEIYTRQMAQAELQEAGLVA